MINLNTFENVYNNINLERVFQLSKPHFRIHKNQVE